MTSRLSRNTFTLLVSNGGSAVLSFLLSVLIGRTLGEGGLGVYTTALAWIFPLTLIAEWGLGTLITRDVAQDTSQSHAYLQQTTLFRLGIGSILLLVTLLLAPLASDDPLVVQGILISAPLILILPYYGSFTAIFRAHQIMRPIAFLNIGMLISQVTLTALVFLNGGDVIDALLVNTITSTGQLIVAWGIYRKAFYQSDSKHTLDIKRLFRRAFPFAIAAILAALQARISIILLEQYTNTSQVGYFSAASRFIEAGKMLPNALFGALFPALSALIANPAQMERLFRRISLGLAGFGGFVAITLTLLAHTILLLTYGVDFLPATEVLQLLGWSLLPSLLRAGRTLYWYAYEQESWVNKVNAIVLIVQVILSILLIPTLSAIGVALVLLIIEWLAVILLWRPIHKSTNLPS